MGENVAAIFAMAVGLIITLIITVTAILADTISKYKLKVEQIRADALVRTEEVRTRNQLELEKLLHQEQMHSSDNVHINRSASSQSYEDSTKLKGRMRE